MADVGMLGFARDIEQLRTAAGVTRQQADDIRAGLLAIADASCPVISHDFDTDWSRA